MMMFTSNFVIVQFDEVLLILFEDFDINVSTHFTLGNFEIFFNIFLSNFILDFF